MPNWGGQIDSERWLKKHKAVSEAEFLSLLSHTLSELQTTLVAMMGYLGILSQGNSGTEAEKLTKQLRETAKRILAETNSLLEVKLTYERQRALRESITRFAGRKPRILHFEDDSMLSEMYSVKCTQAGLEYVHYWNPTRNPVRVVRKEHPDLILMDVLMPVMDGFQATAALKADERSSSIPVVFLTNLGQDDDVNKGLSLGATDYIISADLMPDEVMNRVRRALHLPPIVRVQPKGQPIENQTTKFSRYQDLASDEEINKRIASRTVSKGSWIRRLFR